MTRVRLGRYNTAILKDGCIYSGATVGYALCSRLDILIAMLEANGTVSFI